VDAAWFSYSERGTAARYERGETEEPPDAIGGVREPRRPKPPKLSPGAEASLEREGEGLCVVAA